MILFSGIVGRPIDRRVSQNIVSVESLSLPHHINQRTNGPVNAHLISRPSKAQNIHNLENIWKEMTLTFNTHIPL